MEIITVTLAIAVITVALLLLVLAVNVFIGKDHKKLKRVPLPGPRPWPILGCSPLLGNYDNAWDGFSALRRIYGDLYGLKLGSRYCVVVSSAQTMRQILVNRAHEFANRPDFLRFHAIFRGDRNFSVALCDWSPKHRVRRDTAFTPLHPRYTSPSGQNLNNITETELRIMVNDLEKTVGQPIDPKQFLLNATANIFYRYICGTRFEPDDARFQETVRIYDEVFRELFQGFAIDFMPWLRWFNRARLDDLREQAETVGRFTDDIFKEHETTLNPENPRDLVDQFLLQSPNLSREDAEVIIDDLIGGHSVLSNMWLWALYLLALHPEAREEIRAETETLMAKTKRNPSLMDRNDMPYTEAVIFEVLRIVASPIIPHVATNDTTLDGYHVPKDSLVMFNTFDLNTDPTLWEKPMEFRPRRFLENGKLSKPNYFIPFGVGKRSCLGDGLVKSILLLGLPYILRTMDFELAPGMPVWGVKKIAGLVLSKEPIKLVFRSLTNEARVVWNKNSITRSSL